VYLAVRDGPLFEFSNFLLRPVTAVFFVSELQALKLLDCVVTLLWPVFWKALAGIQQSSGL
jgi:hypothetical protein